MARPRRAREPRPPLLVPVPVDLALVYDAVRGWHYAPAPPAWWLEEQEALLAHDERPQERLRLVLDQPEKPVPVTPCRPGIGPCGRRHEHASERRAG